MERTKKEIMRKYEQGEPKLFIQYSAWDRSNADTQVLEELYREELDRDKHCLEEELVYELMRGADIRILVNPKASKNSVLQLLGKIMNRIKEDDRCRLAAKDELRKITKLKEIEGEMQEVSENEDLEDVEYLFASINEILDKKREEIADAEIPF